MPFTLGLVIVISKVYVSLDLVSFLISSSDLISIPLESDDDLPVALSLLSEILSAISSAASWTLASNELSTLVTLSTDPSGITPASACAVTVIPSTVTSLSNGSLYVSSSLLTRVKLA